MPDRQHEQFTGWSEFFERQHARLLRYAVHVTGDRVDAEDLIQDVLVGLVRRGAAPQSALPYVLQALRNRWIDVTRGRAVRPQTRSIELLEVAVPEPDDDRPARLACAVAGLSSARRELIVLKVHCGLTFREIAELLGRPLGTVASDYARTLDELRALVGEEMTRG